MIIEFRELEEDPGTGTLNSLLWAILSRSNTLVIIFAWIILQLNLQAVSFL